MVCEENGDACNLASIYHNTLLDDVIPFWTAHSVDRDMGGFLTFLDRDGAVYSTDKPVWLQGRIGWLFAKLYNSRVHDYSLTHFADPEYGEWFGYLHRDGTVSHRLKGNGWKGPYHLSRALVLCWKLLEGRSA